ncbi:flagellar basal body P-ring formation chaperone FlgA [Rhizobium sp. L1K21]|uniref:flagellar basal body P-ring formation chaperone FlgA n=1 Tax=Rhizobium sp. L1K21 TaxID=2954933 RepID=UPI002093908E|nr:flagellar basal body P-ring formation chaperone FlgA [Rhizobium sp. L1K21]MCO6187124.1 flagellar basal body P-ring formation chaperone FlgA [Rhizobium sp. L1K21]
MMRQLFERLSVLKWTGAALALSLIGVPAFAEGDLYAVVPTHTIYPGEVLTASRLEEVKVTNPNLKGDFAQSISQVEGKVTKRTLMAGHAVYISGLREPFVVNRGEQVRIVYMTNGLQISALGLPLEDAVVGDVIRVRNSDSGLTISGIVLDDGSVKVLTK